MTHASIATTEACQKVQDYMSAKQRKSVPTAPLYIVMQDFGKFGLESVTNPDMTRESIILDILGGQFNDILYVIEVLPLEGTSRDITDDITAEVDALKAARAA